MGFKFPEELFFVDRHAGGVRFLHMPPFSFVTKLGFLGTTTSRAQYVLSLCWLTVYCSLLGAERRGAHRDSDKPGHTDMMLHPYIGHRLSASGLETARDGRDDGCSDLQSCRPDAAPILGGQYLQCAHR